MIDTKEKHCPGCHKFRLVDDRKWGPIRVGSGRNIGKIIGYKCPDCVAKTAKRVVKK